MWRGAWVIVDAILLPSMPIASMCVSILAGAGGLVVAAAIQPSLAACARRCRGEGRERGSPPAAKGQSRVRQDLAPTQAAPTCSTGSTSCFVDDEREDDCDKLVVCDWCQEYDVATRYGRTPTPARSSQPRRPTKSQGAGGGWVW